MKKWRCTVCGYIYDGDSPPEKCPNCGAPREKFEAVEEKQAQLIERSRLSNGLHMRLYTLLGEVAEVAQKGVEDNLDPRCFEIFTQAKENAYVTRQRVKAEIQTHIGKGKWG
jgi:predicted  nucleic acid-binding Zn-ribbon protein